MSDPIKEPRLARRKWLPKSMFAILLLSMSTVVLERICSVDQAKKDGITRWLDEGVSLIMEQKAEHVLGFPLPRWGRVVDVVRGPNFYVIQLADKRRLEAIDLFVSNSGCGLRLEDMMEILDEENEHIRRQHSSKENHRSWSDFAPRTSGQRILHLAADQVRIEQVVFPRLEPKFIGRRLRLRRKGRILDVLAFGTNNSFDDNSFQGLVSTLTESMQ